MVSAAKGFCLEGRPRLRAQRQSFGEIAISQSKATPILFALLFALAGAVSRYVIRDTETRFQILVFWLAASVTTLFLLRPSRSSSALWSFLTIGTSATVAIMLTKFAIEGLPHSVDRVLTGF